jgi:hypothetical protein
MGLTRSKQATTTTTNNVPTDCAINNSNDNHNLDQLLIKIPGKQNEVDDYFLIQRTRLRQTVYIHTYLIQDEWVDSKDIALVDPKAKKEETKSIEKEESREIKHKIGELVYLQWHPKNMLVGTQQIIQGVKTKVRHQIVLPNGSSQWCEDKDIRVMEEKRGVCIFKKLLTTKP